MVKMFKNEYMYSIFFLFFPSPNTLEKYEKNFHMYWTYYTTEKDKPHLNRTDMQFF